MKDLTDVTLACDFHETYERLAPKFGYSTRKDSAVPWPEVPEQNRQLMAAVAAEIIERHIEPLRRKIADLSSSGQ